MHPALKGAFAGLAFLTLQWLSFAAASAGLAAQLLVYRVAEPGVEPYISRILVTREYLRMDQGQGDDGFILLDRLQKVIYSVSSADKMILQINPAVKVRILPEGMKLEAKISQGRELPELPASKTEYWRFFVNDELCRSAVVAPDLMQQARRAYGEYLDLLALQHLTTLQAIPPEMQDPCDQAIHIFEPLAVIDKGLPLREWGEQGWRQELIDYRERFEAPDDSFKLPEEYHRTRLGELQGGS
ncbi:MAG: UDP-2,3-diacylglucosamine hydrolase [Pseudomonadota bacterium]